MNILDPDGNDAAERAIDEMENEIEAPTREDEPEELELGRPIDDEPSRDEKRRNRYREAQEAASEAQRQRDAAEARARAAEERIARMEGVVQTLAQQRPGETRDEYVERVQATREKAKGFWEEYERATKSGNVDAEAYRKKAHELDDELHENQFLRLAKKYGLQAPTPADDATRQLMTHYPDVMQKEEARLYARGTWNQLRATGEPNNWQTVQKAFNAARQKFGLGGGKPSGGQPTDADKRRLSGSAKGGRGKEPRKSIKMTKEMKQMADAAYSHLPEEKRYQHWANEVGSELE